MLLHTQEKLVDVQNHLFSALSQMGTPKAIKTDNGSAYNSKAFQKFCQTFQIKHLMDIPYNSQGQAIVKRTNGILKSYLKKLKEGETLQGTVKYSPHMHLTLTLYVLNFLNVDDIGRTAAELFRHPDFFLPFLMLGGKTPMMGTWKGPDPVLHKGGSFVCVFLRMRIPRAGFQKGGAESSCLQQRMDGQNRQRRKRCLPPGA